MDAARKKKRPLPQWYLDRPADVRGAEVFSQAFADLITCRPPDGAIPWTAAKLYADHKGYEPDVFDCMWEVVKAMDRAQRDWMVAELKASMDG